MNNMQSKQLKRQQTDKILLQAIATSADVDAFLILYDRYGQRLLRHFHRSVNNVDTVFDLSQNFWLYIWQNASQLIYENNDSAERLFFYMATKRIADYYRSSIHKREIPLDDFPNLSDKESSSSSPESDYCTEEIRKITERVLSKYSELDKQIFICQKELDYPAQQTASQFNISIECIYKKVSIIMKELRFQLRLAGYYSLFACLCLQQMM
ncbi:RNA polymerase sigma factor [Bacteroides reticulotermitis]|uniref:RNA polymerase sigma factor n=1 Tax=Bacteroides reticulotermitis TaxID=1133319 RepID=UPI003A8B8A57